MTGTTGYVNFNIWERKDILINVGYPIQYFNFSFCGNGFEFLMSADAVINSTTASIIAFNYGYLEQDGSRHHIVCSTEIKWLAVVLA